MLIISPSYSILFFCRQRWTSSTVLRILDDPSHLWEAFSHLSLMHKLPLFFFYLDEPFNPFWLRTTYDMFYEEEEKSPLALLFCALFLYMLFLGTRDHYVWQLIKHGARRQRDVYRSPPFSLHHQPPFLSLPSANTLTWSLQLREGRNNVGRKNISYPKRTVSSPRSSPSCQESFISAVAPATDSEIDYLLSRSYLLLGSSVCWSTKLYSMLHWKGTLSSDGNSEIRSFDAFVCCHRSHIE